ncbi:hypothetical protein PM03_09615 [Thalassobacter stenotrophicus]|uniref:flagellar hook-length control protein FliK n=1 Tax=Thalassobacter TaxID=266808 RepID=UPI00051F9FF4|nr:MULTISPECIES: flagellar hook-length control protein FliK [Thalassobacter]KGK79727.1 hypothetical protein PM03_09615 [Thalassobacter stenotrophicus]
MNGPTQILDLGQGFLRPMSAPQGGPRVVPASVSAELGAIPTQGVDEVFSDALAVAQSAEFLPKSQQADLTDLVPDAPSNILTVPEVPTVDIAAITALLNAAPQTQALPKLTLPQGLKAPTKDALIDTTEVEMMLAPVDQTLGASLPVAQVTLALHSTDVPTDLTEAAPKVISDIDIILDTAPQLVSQPVGQAITSVPVTELVAAKAISPHFEMLPYPAAKVVPLSQGGNSNEGVTLPAPAEFKGLPQQSPSPPLTNLGPVTDAVSVEVKPVEATDALQAPKPHSTVARSIVQATAVTPEVAQQATIPATSVAPELTTIAPAMTVASAQPISRKTDPARIPTDPAPTIGLSIDDATGLNTKTISDQGAILQSTARLRGTLPRDATPQLPPETRPSGEATVMTSAAVPTSTTGAPAPGPTSAQGPMQQSAMAGAMLDVRHQGWTKTLVNRAAQSVQAGGTLTLSILPQHLGQITLKLSEGRKGMELRITAEVASTASMLRGVETQISGAFNEAGLKLASFSANTGGQGKGGDTPNERRDTASIAASANTVDEATQAAADTSSLISIIA